jgi:hypothetical protein
MQPNLPVATLHERLADGSRIVATQPMPDTHRHLNLRRILRWLLHMDDPVTLNHLELLHDSGRPSDFDLVSLLRCA